MSKKKYIEYIPGFILFKIILKRKEELFASVILMLSLMFFASVCIYYFEKDAQPDNFSNIWQAMWWAVAALTTVGYGDVYPITVMGKVFAAVIAMCGIGMFALPAGILGSGFVDEIEQKKKEKDLKEKSGILLGAFRYESSITTRRLVDKLELPHMRKVLDVDHTMASLQYSQDEVFEAIGYSPSLRIRACKQSRDSLYEDNFIIESFPVNASFGSVNNRGSNIHVISTQSGICAGIGHFSRTLAHALNANYYSNEFFSTSNLRKETLINFASNEFYNETDHQKTPQALKEWISYFDKWVKPNDLVIYLGTTVNLDYDLHVLCGGEKGQMSFNDVKTPTFTPVKSVVEFYTQLANNLNELDMKLTTHSLFGNTNANHLSQVLNNKYNANVITIYVGASLLEFTPIGTYYKSIKILKDCIVSELSIKN